MDEYLAKISFFGFYWCPRSYMTCDGTLVAISQNTALFSLIGAQFGGNGSSNFALPDLRGRGVLGQGTSDYGQTFQIGQKSGAFSTTLTEAQLPVHTHAAALTLENATTTVYASDADGTATKPSSRTGATLGALASPSDKLYNNLAPNVSLNVAGNTVAGTVDIGSAGYGQPFTNMPPYTVLNACILTQGWFPQRP